MVVSDADIDDVKYVGDTSDVTPVITTLLSAFGRAISEVGAVMIVGGNIDHYTRVMTTAISLETRMGNLEYAMALGLVLISITIIIYSLVYLLNNRSIKWK